MKIVGLNSATLLLRRWAWYREQRIEVEPEVVPTTLPWAQVWEERSELVHREGSGAYAWFLSLAHWGGVMALLLSVWSGITIARDQHAWMSLLRFPGMQSVLFWHLFAAGIWLSLITAFLIFAWKKSRLRKASPPPAVLKSSRSKKQIAHQMSVRIIYFSTVILLLSGLSVLVNLSTSTTSFLRGLHFLAAGVFLGTILWHLWVQWKIAAWKRIRSIFFRLTFSLSTCRKLGRASLVCVLGGVFAVLSLTGWQSSQWVYVPKITGEITIDGEANEAQWQKAEHTVVSTYYGMHQQGQVPIDIKLMNDGYSLYLHAKWPDPTKSMRHLPLVKTEQGWRVQQSQYLQADETQYYEDKFAVMVGAGPWDALRSVFLGGGEQRGGHRTSQENWVDIWHWKSVRNHGYANLDDAYFATDLKPLPGQRRYTWGYGSDPLLAGSYVENWEYFFSETVRPLRLPRQPEMLAAFQRPAGVDGAQDPAFGLHWVNTQPYDSALDTYPVGTVMPSVVWYHPNEGDRADVRAAGVWKEGYWHLEMARNFETDSDYDRTIEDGIYLWLASFDHSQIRHTYHLRPLRLKLEK